MAFEPKSIGYSGSITEVALGSGDKTLTVGGETAYPFHVWEGVMPNKPVLAMEVWDMEPDDWPAACSKPFEGVLNDPGAWAKKCVEEYGADAIVVQLKSTDPNGEDAPPEKACEAVGKVLDNVDVPVIIWGSANAAKDSEVLKALAEKFSGKNLLLGPVDEDNHKAVGATALAYKQSIIASSPIDVNLAKQLNILLENLGMPMDKLIIDPTTGGLGYGMEYSYSVMERIRMAALVQEDDKLVLPMINNVGNEVWKSKEAKLEGEESASMGMGDDSMRGVLMEATAAVSYLLAGSDILILRHPDTLKLMRGFIDGMLTQRAAAGEKIAAERDKVAAIVAAKPAAKAAKPAPAAAKAAKPPPPLKPSPPRRRRPRRQNPPPRPPRPIRKRKPRPRPRRRPRQSSTPKPRQRRKRKPRPRPRRKPRPRPRRKPKPRWRRRKRLWPTRKPRRPTNWPRCAKSAPRSAPSVTPRPLRNVPRQRMKRASNMANTARPAWPDRTPPISSAPWIVSGCGATVT